MDNKIVNKILTTLYEEFFKGDKKYHLGELRKTNGWNELEFTKIADRLIHDLLIEPYSLGGYYKITSDGIVHTENEIKEPADIISENETFRTDLLNSLSDEYDKKGAGNRFHYHDLKNKFDDRLLNSNLDVLRDLDYIEFDTNSSFHISYNGIDAVKEWKDKVAQVIQDNNQKKEGNLTHSDNHDVFICHASEDKESFVRSLAEVLKEKGLTVWYDEFSLTVGDSLRRSIDHGLAQARYGIVILSQNFFNKEWPQRELDGLTAKEVKGEKVILPIWHNVSHDEVLSYSPVLADRVGVLTSKGLDHVVDELLKAMSLSVRRGK